ncbi:MAG: hypothetical protein ACYDHZ_01090 [Dehalococcoidia bacterium]|jgi:uncharacterized protein YejL (UPF0352 family)
MTEKKPRGAPKGNQNARKHGFYSQVLDEAQTLQLDQALEVEGIDEEIAILRVKLLSLIDKHPDRVDLQVITANTIARLIRTRYNVSKDQHKPLKEAITKVLTDIAVPLGIKALIK